MRRRKASEVRQKLHCNARPTAVPAGQRTRGQKKRKKETKNKTKGIKKEGKEGREKKSTTVSDTDRRSGFTACILLQHGLKTDRGQDG